MYTPTDKHEAAGSRGQILPGSGIPVAVLRKLAAELRRAHSGKLSPEIVAAAVASLLPAPTPEADSRAEVATLDLPAPWHALPRSFCGKCKCSNTPGMISSRSC